jgi:outer membrane receptor protein involved in Fe transport
MEIMSAAKTARWAPFLLASTVLAGAAPAIAQDAGRGGLDEIIITAQKREENLQTAPIAVQALGNTALEELNITDYNDLAKFLPNVSFRSPSPGFSQVYIRGVSSGENSNHSASLPTVGVSLDEQPITTITGALDIHAYDLARVEVLAGPQGTLYGASSEAGTVRIITNKPSTAGFEAGYDIEANTITDGGNGGSLEGFVNIPLDERAAVRIVAWAQHDGGYIDNINAPRTYPTSGAVEVNPNPEEDYNEVDTYGLRAALKIDIDENWSVTPSVMTQKQDTEGVFGYDRTLGETNVAHAFPENSNDSWAQAALTVQGLIGNFDVVYTTAYLHRDVYGQQDYADYSYWYDVLSGYGIYFYDNVADFINPAQRINYRDGYRKTSHELRLSSPAEHRLRFVGGLFFQEQTHDIEQRYIVDGLGDALEVTGWPDTVWLTEQQRIDKDSAIFGELSFDLTDALTLTAGVRGFHADNALKGYFGFGAGFAFASVAGEAFCFAPTPVVPGGPCTNLDKSVEESGSTHRLNVNYTFDDDHLIYFTYSTGFRPGGINRRGSLPPYDSDELTNYEIGWKTQWFDDRLRFNGAVFYQEWADFQYSLLGAQGLTEIQNAGNAEIKGIEGQLNWAVTDVFTLNGSAIYQKGETTTDLCEVGDDGDPDTVDLPDCVNANISPAGTRLPASPEFKANLTGRFDWMWGDWETFAQLAVVYQGDVTNDLRTEEQALMGTIDAYTLADLSAGVERDGLRFSVYVNNLTDELAEFYRYAECATSVCASNGQTYSVIAQPRTFGIRVGQSF